MTANVGTIDRVIRLVLGLVLLSQVFMGLQTPWGWIGLILVGTAAIKFCPAYRIFGLKTCSS